MSRKVPLLVVLLFFTLALIGCGTGIPAPTDNACAYRLADGSLPAGCSPAESALPTAVPFADGPGAPEVIDPSQWEQGFVPAPAVGGGITLNRTAIEAMGANLAAQVEALKAVGWSDQAIFEAYTEGRLPVEVAPQLRVQAFGAEVAAGPVAISSIELPGGLFRSPVTFASNEVISRPHAYEISMDGNVVAAYTVLKTETDLPLPVQYDIRPFEPKDDRLYQVKLMVGDCPIVGVWQGGVEVDTFTMTSPDGWDEGVCVRDLDLVVGQGELRLDPAQGKMETFIYINPAYSHINGYFGENAGLYHRDHRYRYEQTVPVNEVVRFADTRPVHVGLGGAISWRVSDLALLYADQYGLLPMRYASPAVLINEAGFRQLELCQEIYGATPGQMCVLPGQTLTFEIMILPGTALQEYHDYPWQEWLTDPSFCGVAAWYNRTITTQNGEGLVACGSEWTQFTLFGFPAEVIPAGTPINQVPPEWVMWWGLGTPPQFDPQAGP